MNWHYIAEASLAIQIHLVAAIAALVLGCVMWLRPKGTPSHKLTGRGFMIFMILAAFSAIFIRQINDGSFSFIHLFVPLTFFGAWQAIVRIRRKNLKGHLSAVRGLFFGALIIPGLFAFLPGRLMWAVFFG